MDLLGIFAEEIVDVEEIPPVAFSAVIDAVLNNVVWAVGEEMQKRRSEQDDQCIDGCQPMCETINGYDALAFLICIDFVHLMYL